MVMLSINGIDCYYGSAKVLENIKFSIKSGDFLGVLGPNGSGKTTLLRSISRTLKPRVGTILLNEKDVYTLKSIEVAKSLAVVPQETAVAFAFTALDIVLMGRNPHLNRFEMENHKDLAIAKEAMELTNTWNLADKLITELSSGERQRVVIARALAQEPKVLLLDEPTSHLDISHQIEILDLIEKLNKEKGLVIIAVFHDLNLAARYCNLVLLLKKGKIISLGPPDAVLTAENIKRVYHVDALVKRHPVTNSIYVTPLPLIKSRISSNKVTVHLICGAGTGAPIMSSLINIGYNVTAGVLNVLDTDYEIAHSLSISVVSEAPFSPITEESHQANLKLINQAKVVIVANTPFGYGNLRNLEAAEIALGKKIPVLLIEETPIAQRDFAKGEAQKLFARLKGKGAISVQSYDEVLSFIETNIEANFE
ncbi:MAG: ABC transporter ATP-binding protein [Euryarchaeota archaeon]|nr:ABC transporter ATP-binding protein [Euryarchaeota archaeon]